MSAKDNPFLKKPIVRQTHPIFDQPRSNSNQQYQPGSHNIFRQNQQSQDRQRNQATSINSFPLNPVAQIAFSAIQQHQPQRPVIQSTIPNHFVGPNYSNFVQSNVSQMHHQHLQQQQKQNQLNKQGNHNGDIAPLNRALPPRKIANVYMDLQVSYDQTCQSFRRENQITGLQKPRQSLIHQSLRVEQQQLILEQKLQKIKKVGFFDNFCNFLKNSQNRRNLYENNLQILIYCWKFFQETDNSQDQDSQLEFDQQNRINLIENRRMQLSKLNYQKKKHFELIEQTILNFRNDLLPPLMLAIIANKQNKIFSVKQESINKILSLILTKHCKFDTQSKQWQETFFNYENSDRKKTYCKTYINAYKQNIFSQLKNFDNIANIFILDLQILFFSNAKMALENIILQENSHQPIQIQNNRIQKIHKLLKEIPKQLYDNGGLKKFIENKIKQQQKKTQKPKHYIQTIKINHLPDYFEVLNNFIKNFINKSMQLMSFKQYNTQKFEMFRNDIILKQFLSVVYRLFSRLLIPFYYDNYIQSQDEHKTQQFVNKIIYPEVELIRKITQKYLSMSYKYFQKEQNKTIIQYKVTHNYLKMIVDVLDNQINILQNIKRISLISKNKYIENNFGLIRKQVKLQFLNNFLISTYGNLQGNQKANQNMNQSQFVELHQDLGLEDQNEISKNEIGALIDLVVFLFERVILPQVKKYRQNNSLEMKSKLEKDHQHLQEDKDGLKQIALLMKLIQQKFILNNRLDMIVVRYLIDNENKQNQYNKNINNNKKYNHYNNNIYDFFKNNNFKIIHNNANNNNNNNQNIYNKNKFNNQNKNKYNNQNNIKVSKLFSLLLEYQQNIKILNSKQYIHHIQSDFPKKIIQTTIIHILIAKSINITRDKTSNQTTFSQVQIDLFHQLKLTHQYQRIKPWVKMLSQYPHTQIKQFLQSLKIISSKQFMDENIYFILKKQLNFSKPKEHYNEPAFNFILNFQPKDFFCLTRHMTQFCQEKLSLFTYKNNKLSNIKPLPKFKEMYGLTQRFIDGYIHNNMISQLWKNNGFQKFFPSQGNFKKNIKSRVYQNCSFRQMFINQSNKNSQQQNKSVNVEIQMKKFSSQFTFFIQVFMQRFIEQITIDKQAQSNQNDQFKIIKQYGFETANRVSIVEHLYYLLKALSTYQDPKFIEQHFHHFVTPSFIICVSQFLYIYEFIIIFYQQKQQNDQKSHYSNEFIILNGYKPFINQMNQILVILITQVLENQEIYYKKDLQRMILFSLVLIGKFYASTPKLSQQIIFEFMNKMKWQKQQIITQFQKDKQFKTIAPFIKFSFSCWKNPNLMKKLDLQKTTSEYATNLILSVNKNILIKVSENRKKLIQQYILWNSDSDDQKAINERIYGPILAFNISIHLQLSQKIIKFCQNQQIYEHDCSDNERLVIIKPILHLINQIELLYERSLVIVGTRYKNYYFNDKNGNEKYIIFIKCVYKFKDFLEELTKNNSKDVKKCNNLHNCLIYLQKVIEQGKINGEKQYKKINNIDRILHKNIYEQSENIEYLFAYKVVELKRQQKLFNFMIYLSNSVVVSKKQHKLQSLTQIENLINQFHMYIKVLSDLPKMVIDQKLIENKSRIKTPSVNLSYILNFFELLNFIKNFNQFLIRNDSLKISYEDLFFNVEIPKQRTTSYAQIYRQFDGLWKSIEFFQDFCAEYKFFLKQYMKQDQENDGHVRLGQSILTQCMIFLQYIFVLIKQIIKQITLNEVIVSQKKKNGYFDIRIQNMRFFCYTFSLKILKSKLMDDLFYYIQRQKEKKKKSKYSLIQTKQLTKSQKLLEIFFKNFFISLGKMFYHMIDRNYLSKNELQFIFQKQPYRNYDHNSRIYQNIRLIDLMVDRLLRLDVLVPKSVLNLIQPVNWTIDLMKQELKLRYIKEEQLEIRQVTEQEER